MGSSSPKERSEARFIYDSACEEVTVLLRSTGELWNKPQTIPSGKGTYRLRFAAGSRTSSTWDPGYFDFFRTRNIGSARPWVWQLLVNGTIDRHAYDLGALDTSLPFAELKRRSHINDRARAADRDPDFSSRILI